MIYTFMNTFMVKKQIYTPSLLSGYAQISCRYMYESLLKKYRHPPIIYITTQLILLEIQIFITQTQLKQSTTIHKIPQYHTHSLHHV